MAKAALCGSLLLVASLSVFGAGVLQAGPAGTKASAPHPLTVRAVYRLCSRGPSPPRVPRGVRSVRGYYRIIPLGGPGETGVLLDRQVAPDAAFEFLPLPPSGHGMVMVRVAKDALVVFGPPLLGPQSRRGMPEGAQVVVRGTLYCRHLHDWDPGFVGVKKTPFLIEKSWRPVQRAPAGTVTPPAATATST